MRLALIADIHSNLAALEAVASDLKRRGVDQVVNLGDSVSGPLLPRETAQFLMAEGWLTIAGNHERQLLNLPPDEQGASDAYTLSQLTSAEMSWLRSQPPTARLSPDIFLCHGTPNSDVEYFLESIEDGQPRPAHPHEIEERLGQESASLIACGHTHIPRSVRSGRGQCIVNPGSVGLPAYDATDPVPHVMATGSPNARYAIVEKGREGWMISLISVPYDFRAMARLAKIRQRPEWEQALLTGSLFKLP